VAAGIALFVPYVYLRRKRATRIRVTEEQFPEALDLIARALRAGHAFTTAIGMVSEEIGPPVGAEFQLLYEHQNFGMPLPEALKKFAERLGLLDARFFVTAVLTQREAGGNLAEVLDRLANVMRERFKILLQVRVYTAQGRMSGYLLAALPIVTFIGLNFMLPGYEDVLTKEKPGQYILAGAAVMQIIGFLVIRKIINIRI
jgi:tight adherence protein B